MTTSIGAKTGSEEGPAFSDTLFLKIIKKENLILKNSLDGGIFTHGNQVEDFDVYLRLTKDVIESP